MAKKNNLITSDDEPAYFAMIPNWVDEANLTVYAYRLYGHLKRVTGESGKCWQSTATLSTCCNMSRGMISKAKKELADKGLIEIKSIKRPVGGHDYHEIVVRNIWRFNRFFFENIIANSRSERATSSHEPASSQSDTKEYPVKENASNKNHQYIDTAVAVSPYSLPGEKASPVSSRDEADAGRKHPCIQEIKRVTGRYPRKETWNEFIKVWDSHPSENKSSLLIKIYKAWILKGYNPLDYAGWYFDWFGKGTHYQPDDVKLLIEEIGNDDESDLEVDD